MCIVCICIIAIYIYVCIWVVIFHSYVKLPEGMWQGQQLSSSVPIFLPMTPSPLDMAWPHDPQQMGLLPTYPMSRTSCHQSADHGRQVPSYLADSYHVFLSSWCVFTKSQFPNFPIPNAIIKHHDPQSINKMLPFWGWVNPAGHQHNSDSWMFIRPNLWNPSKLNDQFWHADPFLSHYG